MNNQLIENDDNTITVLHNILRNNLIDSFGLKFEICLAMARSIIRLDYRTYDLNRNTDEIFSNTHQDVITIAIDTSTSKKVYQQILDNIYRASKLSAAIKGSTNFSKEEKLLILVDINFYSHYKQLSQQQIIQKLEELGTADIQYKPVDTNEINRLIKLAKAIRETSNIIAPSHYLV